MAELVFFSGTMDCGKSTLALQMDHNHTVAGRAGLLFTQHDRAGGAGCPAGWGCSARRSRSPTTSTSGTSSSRTGWPASGSTS